ncbi:hypothetical protein A3Q56_03440 [Intoshia linei]|uniref:Nuclear speckle splicing regulatory protein 1 N-terminal domain-containing protein n=1 Tax=Intoshia linei TaxID=1819745 RepID=A0A177B3S9_9BILA|nr:hypothetical protein A3Q56_03440 [Intoshia linei]
MQGSQNSGKKFGLFTKKQKKYGVTLPPSNIFRDDSDDEIDSSNKYLKPLPKICATQKNITKKDKILANEALKEAGPSIFQYDEVYDNMVAAKNKKLDSITDKHKKDKSRYIGNLVRAANKRKLEFELRQERIIEKERKEEGDQFQDKESFVTNAWKEKLEILKKEAELEKQQDLVEERMNVKNQMNLGGFYRNILEKTTNERNIDITTTEENIPNIPEKVEGVSTQNPEKARKFHRNHRIRLALFNQESDVKRCADGSISKIIDTNQINLEDMIKKHTKHTVNDKLALARMKYFERRQELVPDIVTEDQI